MNYIASYGLLALIGIFIMTSDYYRDNIHPYVEELLFDKMHPCFVHTNMYNMMIVKNIGKEIQFEDDKQRKRKMSKVDEEKEYQNFEVN